MGKPIQPRQSSPQQIFTRHRLRPEKRPNPQFRIRIPQENPETQPRNPTRTRGDTAVSQAQTSIAAYQQKKKNGSLTGDRHKIFQLIQEHQPVPGNQIARKMQKPYHTISGRITELLQQDYIEVAGTTENQFGNKVRTYKVKK